MNDDRPGNHDSAGKAEVRSSDAPKLDEKTLRYIDGLVESAVTETIPELFGIMIALAEESDRGCVLVGAAWIEDTLGRAVNLALGQLRRRGQYREPLAESTSHMNALVNGVLEKARNRIIFCRAIGMIDRSTEKAIAALSSLRHKHFAHFPGIGGIL